MSLTSVTLPSPLAACTARITQPTTPSSTAAPVPTPRGTPAALVAPTLRATTTRATAGEHPSIIVMHGNSNASSLWHSMIWRYESNGWSRERLFAVDFPYPTARDDGGVAQTGRSGSEEQRGQLLAVLDPRSSAYVGLRLWPDAALPDKGLVVFTRPRGYIAGGRDTALLDGRPLPGLKSGLPTEGTFRVPFAGPERAIVAARNGEAMTVRNIPGAITYAEFHY